MTAELARVGGPLGCAGLALVLVAPRRDLRLAGLAAWAAGALLLAVHLAPHGNRAKLVAAGVVGLALAAAGAAVIRRWPWLLAFAALACAPARIPVSVGDTDAKLLVPLYGVVAAGAIAFAWELVRGDGRARELGPLAWPLAAFVAWTGLSLAWSEDLDQGAIELLFFYLPFGLLAVSLGRLPWRPRRLALLGGQLVAMACAFAAIGIYQWLAHDVFWNRKLIVGNAYASLYRVNGVFYDPSIYGRFLVVAILVALVVALRRPALALYAVAPIALCWTGLLFSFSQSSFISLAAGVVAAAALAWPWRSVAAVALAGAALVLAGAAAPPARADVTGGRLKLVSNGLDIAVHHPVGGVGVGAFKRAYGEKLHLRGSEPRSAASHTTPVTVAAETGLPGLALFAWLLGGALLVPLRRTTGAAGLVRLACGVALFAIAVHSLGYNALLEDPMFWGLLALLALTVRREPAS